jgi:hypothetical protein
VYGLKTKWISQEVWKKKTDAELLAHTSFLSKGLKKERPLMTVDLMTRNDPEG